MPIAILCLLLMGYYYLTNDLARLLCLIGAIGLVIVCTVVAVLEREWILLIVPTILIVFWMIFAGAEKKFKNF